MMSLSDNAALGLYGLAVSVLGIHLLVLAGWTGTVRVLRKQWVNPEDATLNKGAQTESDHPDVQRVKRAHTNAIENAVPFFVVGLVYSLTAPSRTGALVYLGTFVVARLLHSVFYLWGRQPFRTLCFAVGVLVTLGMSVHVIRAVV